MLLGSFQQVVLDQKPLDVAIIQTTRSGTESFQDRSKPLRNAGVDFPGRVLVISRPCCRYKNSPGKDRLYILQI